MGGRGKTGAKSLKTLLSGGDRRSIRGSARVKDMVLADPGRVADLAVLANDQDWLVALRAMDLLEKLAHDRPDWIQPHRWLFIGPLADSDKWEIRLQIVRALPLLNWDPAEKRRVLAILQRDVNHPQKFVSAWALDGLAVFAQRDRSLMPGVLRRLSEFEGSESRALATRARHIRARIRGKAP
jgi:hypothetical protein